MRKIISILFLLILFFFINQNVFAENFYNKETENKYQAKLLNTIERKYDIKSLSADDINVLENIITITNKNNYKLLKKFVKKDSIEELSVISDLNINNNLKNNNADKKTYEIAYTLLKKGVFTKLPDEELIKPVIQTMYDCEYPIDDNKLAIYGSAFLFHKEKNYNFKELLDSVNDSNYETILEEIKKDAKIDTGRFLPEVKEAQVLIVNLPKPIKEELLEDQTQTVKLSPVKCIISPSYYVTNMLLLSTGMDGSTKKGAAIGLINPINLVSTIFLSPVYIIGKALGEPIREFLQMEKI